MEIVSELYENKAAESLMEASRQHLESTAETLGLPAKSSLRAIIEAAERRTANGVSIGSDRPASKDQFLHKLKKLVQMQFDFTP